MNPSFVSQPHVAGVRHRFIRTSRLGIHLAEAGEGDPVVLVHGWPQHWYAWRDVIPPLAERYHVICPDLRGFGWTDAPRGGYSTSELVEDLLTLLDVLAFDSVYLVGHELGGRLGFTCRCVSRRECAGTSRSTHSTRTGAF